MLRSPADWVSCALFPFSCQLCGDPLPRLALAPICDNCWNLPPQPEAAYCSRCGENLGIDSFWGDARAEQSLCQPCRLAAPPFVCATAYGVYEQRLRALIHLLKYDGVRPAAGPLGKMLAGSVMALLAEEDAPARLLTVPVPLFRSKRRRRGFNHAELLARATVAEVNRRWPGRLRLAAGALERRRATASQAELTPRERRLNLRGAFSAPHPETLRGQHVLLIDDIYTTGATARACSAALLAAGAVSVRVATLARAQREGVARWDVAASGVPAALAPEQAAGAGWRM